ncbi:probable inactive histone-lysine N-methyltransferase SUVR1 isoform X2 [Phalaenopsis equestris]|uniref:probable inactive histone-lysine N-methyltransferase SUVR1 isoform X2 n=1 Tax=Phalaenopsis equestris TaxID=78828 RepID=UPI0009E5DAF7|nr:probable inactive histone-lysine N-methyltransferase SUVR1 isoform X2 [Phalaenopsis equestris]
MAPSAQTQRALSAVKAMKLIGFDQAKAKTVLKKLLKVYENNWEYIEAENYRLLADSILDDEESVPEANETDAAASEAPESSRRRLRRRQEDSGHLPLTIEASASGETSLKRPNIVQSPEERPTNCRGKMIKPVEAQWPHDGEGTCLSPRLELKNGHGREDCSPISGLLLMHEIGKNQPSSTFGSLTCYKKPKIEPNNEVLQDIVAVGFSSIQDISVDDVPITLPPPNGIPSRTSVAFNGNEIESLNVSAQEARSDLSSSPERVSANTYIASSNMGECAVDLATESSKDEHEKVRNVIPPLEPLKRFQSSSPNHILINGSSGGALDLAALEISRQSMNSHDSINDLQENLDPESSGHNALQCLAIVPQQEHAVSVLRPPHDENDIAKGEERVRISLVNELTQEKYPPYFHYIPQNAVYQNAHVNFSLARINDEDCCLSCFGDCLSVPIPCACTRETGGEFAYATDGLLKKEFLDECVSMIRYPDKHHHFYCKDCPIGKSKNEHMPNACKGHLVRKFIKECWSKCGCNKHCGNRVVQRGISRNLQVFFIDGEKGWGLRALEELPRGAFICEYVGEILTNTELYDRTIQKTGGAKHTYPVLLDADWGSEAGLRDEEALCLDATFYGNIGRFVNHRCFDANLVEVPVEWETPDHHYYHLAFFTTRKVEALEELTWDYGIDFDDHSHPIKAFKCLCGSKFCRNKVRSKARSRASGSKRTAGELPVI